MIRWIIAAIVVVELVLMFTLTPPTYVTPNGDIILNPSYIGVKELNPELMFHYIKFGILILATIGITFLLRGKRSD